MKIMNPVYDKINDNPINVWSRNIIGESVKPDDLKGINKTVEKMLNNSDNYSKRINNLVNDSVYNLGKSSKEGAEYIIESLQKKIKRKEDKDEK